MQRGRLLLAGALALVLAGPAHGQFLETFDEPELRLDPSGVDGWAFFTGDGEAPIDASFRCRGADAPRLLFNLEE
jgi:hypothetical protein